MLTPLYLQMHADVVEELNKVPGMEHQDITFIQAVVEKIVNDPQPKFRRLVRNSPPVGRITPLLEIVGFVRSDDDRILYLPIPETEEELSKQCDLLKSVAGWALRRADETRDPDTITFRQVADILQRDGTLPGIRVDIDDTPLHDEMPPIATVERPLKPWEVPTVDDQTSLD